MSKQIQEILNGLKTAIEAEAAGHVFYQNAAQTTEDPVGKETFRRMAEEEMNHLKYLRHQYQAVLEKGGYDLTRELTPKRVAHAENPVFSDEIKTRIKDAHFEVSALTIGMKLELDALKFYRSCAREAGSDEAKKFFTELADWEEDHYLAFERQLEDLKEEYFIANSFVPM